MSNSDEETAVDPSPATRPAGELASGTVLNGVYRIEARLGAGGMGEVYRATNLANDEVDAIKIIGRGRADRTLIEAMFRKEARVLSRIHSPAVARLKLFMRDPALDLLYFVTEFVPGESLLDRLKRRPAKGDELRILMKRVLTGLQAVHEAGAVHRDLSPDNVILPGGDVAQAKIIDFGIAKELDPAATTMVGDSFAGKLGYIAPEQLGFSGSEVGPWTDLYSLALVGVAFAAGKPLEMGHTVGTAEEKRRGAIELSAVSAELRPVFRQMLTYEWNERLRTTGDALAMIDGRTATSVTVPVRSAPTGQLSSETDRLSRDGGPLRRRVAIGVMILLFGTGSVFAVPRLSLLFSKPGVTAASPITLATGPPAPTSVAPSTVGALSQNAKAVEPGCAPKPAFVGFAAGSLSIDADGESTLAWARDKERSCAGGRTVVVGVLNPAEPNGAMLARQRASTVRERLIEQGARRERTSLADSMGDEGTLSYALAQSRHGAFVYVLLTK